MLKKKIKAGHIWGTQTFYTRSTIQQVYQANISMIEKSTKGCWCLHCDAMELSPIAPIFNHILARIDNRACLFGCVTFVNCRRSRSYQESKTSRCAMSRYTRGNAPTLPGQYYSWKRKYSADSWLILYIMDAFQICHVFVDAKPNEDVDGNQSN